MRIPVRLLAVAALAVGGLAVAAPPAAPRALPTQYEAHRFFMTPITSEGRKLRCYTDSGGGGAFLFADRTQPLGFTATVRTVDGEQVKAVDWPAFRADAAIPPPLDAPYFLVLPHDRFAPDTDCFLGQSWFGGRVWTFDYPGKTLWLRDALPAHDKAHEVPLSFKQDKDGRENNFARIEAVIDGEKIPFLFDTGATITLSPAARKQLGDGTPKAIGGSFITQRYFDKWHARHPDWRVIQSADEIGNGALAMIEVPAVTVGGFTVGPAWFAMRPNPNFDQFMSQMMAAHVEGALGGSALHWLRVSVDYPRAIAVFEKP